MRCSIWWLFSTKLLFVFFVRNAHGTIIAKSDITICENTAKNPMNVLYNKKCEKKLVVLAQVSSGQGETAKIYATVNKVYDRVEKEEARLYNPFIVTLSMSPIHLVYPVYYRATVNNKPHEKIEMFTNNRCRNRRKGCAPSYDDNGVYIYDSEGFCCYCDKRVMSFSNLFYFGEFSFNEAYYQHMRSPMDCFHYDAASHCMGMDSLWYDVHEIGTFTFDFTVHVKAYDQVERMNGNKTIIDWVDGGEIALSPQKTGGVGKYGRIIAKYIGKLSGGMAYPRLEDYYLLVPNTRKLLFGFNTHTQLKNGYKDYLIVPIRKVSFNNSKLCDIIGVTYSAFAQQVSYNAENGYGCHQKRGSCLRNQIADLFYEDLERREKGKKTKYFPESFGTITGLKEREGSTDRVVEFESGESTSVQVYLEISADDLILIYNRASGIIVKAYAEQFQAQSRNGAATVIVQNTGYVTADFHVSLDKCSEGVRATSEVSGSINPQMNYEFNFGLEAYGDEGGSFTCTAQLFDSRRYLLDSSVINVNTTKTCICISTCGCSCSGDKTFCKKEANVTFDQTKPGTYDDFFDSFFPKVGGVLGKVVNVVGGVFKSVFDLSKLIYDNLGKFGTILTVVAVVIAIIIAKMACSFIPSGMIFSVVKKVIKTTPVVKAPPPAVVVIREESDAEDTEKGTDLPGEKEKTEQAKSRSSITEFLFEFCFFFILPFVLLSKLLKPLAVPFWRWLTDKMHLLKSRLEKYFNFESDSDENEEESESDDSDSDESDSDESEEDGEDSDEKSDSDKCKEDGKESDDKSDSDECKKDGKGSDDKSDSDECKGNGKENNNNDIESLESGVVVQLS